MIGSAVQREAVEAVAAACGAAARDGATAGVARAASRWRDDDGDEAAFVRFCGAHYVEEVGDRARLLDRLEAVLALVDGHLYEIRRGLRRWSDLEVPPSSAVDDLAAQFDPAPDLDDQWYKQRLAFVALLNFAPPTLATMLAHGPEWSESRWAEARIAQRFGARLDEAFTKDRRSAHHRADAFVSAHQVHVGNVVDAGGRTWFEPGRRLVAHWLIREAIRDGYRADDPAAGLGRQRALAWVMRRHVDGSLPRTQLGGAADDRPWDAEANTLAARTVAESDQVGPARYRHWLELFHIARRQDALDPEAPTAIIRACDRTREIAEADVERLLIELLGAPERRAMNAWLQRRLGRPLEPFDIYFDAALPSADATALDARVAARYPDVGALERALPDLLGSLGFSTADAAFYGSRVRVEWARGAGHAVAPGRPEYPAWLRTNTRGGALTWAGFDIAMHELGHNIEQLTSTHRVPRPALRGVPNTACSEAFAFLFQAEARRALGLEPDADPAVIRAAATLETALSAVQIAGPALLELRAWRWLYDHPNADAEGLRDAVLSLADTVWNAHFAADFGPDPYALTAAYQHMIAYPLYLPNYAIGHIISHQIRGHLAGRDLAAETMRICAIGNVTPALWLQRAVGDDLNPRGLIADAAAATGALERA